MSRTRSTPNGAGGRSLLSLAVFGGLAAVTAILGGLMTASSTDSWYRRIEKPAWNPPDAVFGPVWTVLYAAMALAAWLVWRRGGDRPEGKLSTGLYVVQLGLNQLWTVIFFGLRTPGAALIEIIGLWIAIFAWYKSAVPIDSRVRWLILPYLAWVSFAMTINAGVWWLNR